jgi:hypothetical protein
LDECFIIHAVSLSWRAEWRYGVLPYQEFHEANLDPQVGAIVEKKKPAERRSN